MFIRTLTSNFQSKPSDFSRQCCKCSLGTPGSRILHMRIGCASSFFFRDITHHTSPGSRCRCYFSTGLNNRYTSTTKLWGTWVQMSNISYVAYRVSSAYQDFLLTKEIGDFWWWNLVALLLPAVGRYQGISVILQDWLKLTYWRLWQPSWHQRSRRDRIHNIPGKLNGKHASDTVSTCVLSLTPTKV